MKHVFIQIDSSAVKELFGVSPTLSFGARAFGNPLPEIAVEPSLEYQ
jgi:hypothetical protein